MLYFIDHNTKRRIAIEAHHVVSVFEETFDVKPVSVLSGSAVVSHLTRISMTNGCNFTVDDPGRGTNTSVLYQIEQAKKGMV